MTAAPPWLLLGRRRRLRVRIGRLAMSRRGRFMGLLGVLVSLIMVAHVVLSGCVDVVCCCFGVMLFSIHMRLFCHCSLPFLRVLALIRYDGMASSRVILPLVRNGTAVVNLFSCSTNVRD